VALPWLFRDRETTSLIHKNPETLTSGESDVWFYQPASDQINLVNTPGLWSPVLSGQQENRFHIRSIRKQRDLGVRCDGLNPVQLTFFAGPDVGSSRWSPTADRLLSIL